MWQEKSQNDGSADNPQDCGANNVRKVMRAKVHSRKPDQNRDGQTDEADAAACQNQNTKKRDRGRDVTGRKRVIFSAKTRAAPAEL